MYELFTLGGGLYLVDLLNAVAAITGGGAYLSLAQLAGVAGLAWILFRTAFGGSWKDNAKWVLMFTAVWGAMIVPRATVRVVDRLDPRARARDGGERTHRTGTFRLAHLAGGRRADPAHRTGVHAAERPDVSTTRHDIRLEARRRGDPDGSHRRGVRPQSAQLRPPVHFSCAAARAHLRGRSKGDHGPVESGHQHRFALRRSLPGAAGGVRHEATGRGHGRDAGGRANRDLRRLRRAACGPVGRGDRPRHGDIRAQAVPGRGQRGAGAARN